MYRYIIVDDEPLIRKGARSKIRKTGLPLEFCGEANDGEEALALLRDANPDIIIMDMKMPIMDGREFLTRATDLYPDKKIIVMSGYSDFEYMRDAISARVIDYLLKPFNVGEIADVLASAIKAIETEKTGKHIVMWDGMDKFLVSVDEGNPLQAIEYLNRYFEMLDQLPGMTDERYKDNCAHLLNRIAKKAGARGIGIGDGFSATAQAGQPSMKEIVREAIIGLCQEIRGGKMGTSGLILENVKDYVKKYYYRNITLDQIALAFSISPNYFSHLFKKNTGQSFVGYINSVRVDRAKALLGETDKNTLEIARALGFSNPKYFYRVFRNIAGLTPNEYRVGVRNRCVSGDACEGM